MAKKASLVDKALEVSRKVRVPKKPVKTKGKKTIPAVLDWGTGIPEDKLAYLNDDEMALVQANRMFKGKRSHKGVPAFPDPKDTGAGENSHLPDSGGGAGTGGRPGGSGGQPGSSAPSSGGASSAGAGGQSGASQTKDQSKTAAPSSGPSGGPTSAPARSEPSRASTPPSSFGPRSGGMPGTPVSTAPSSAAVEGALSRIAQGSSVIGNPSNQKQFSDRVPQTQVSTVNLSQSPMANPNRGLGGISQPDENLMVGANSPFASPGLAGYNPETYNSFSTVKSVPSGLLGPSVPVGTAGYTKEQQAARFPGSAAYTTASAPLSSTLPSSSFVATDPRVAQTPVGSYPTSKPVAMDPSLAGRAASAQTLGEQLAFASGAAANKIGSYLGSTAQNVGNYVGSMFGGEPATQTAATKTPAQEAAELQNQINQNKVAVATGINPQTGLPYGEKIQDRVPEYSPPQRTVSEAYGVAQAPTQYTPGDYEKYRTNVENEALARAAISNVANGVNPSNVQPASAPVTTPTAYGPTVGTVDDPYNQRYAKAASNIGGIHPVSYGPTPASVTTGPTDIGTPGYPGQQADISPSQGDYSPSQAPAYDVSPSQQSGWSAEQRDAYLDSIIGGRDGGGTLANVNPQRLASLAGSSGAKTNKTYLAPMPPWQDYDYLYTEYPEIAYAPNQRIIDFNNYNATFKKGGRVGDSVDAALRLARHSIVSRPKTR